MNSATFAPQPADLNDEDLRTRAVAAARGEASFDILMRFLDCKRACAGDPK